MCAGVACIVTSKDCLAKHGSCSRQPHLLQRHRFLHGDKCDATYQVLSSAAAAFIKPRLVIANKYGVVDHKYENFAALGYQGEVHACGGAADIQQVPLDWNGSPWLSFTAAGPTLGAWERVQLGFALCIRDRPGGGITAHHLRCR